MSPRPLNCSLLHDQMEFIGMEKCVTLLQIIGLENYDDSIRRVKYIYMYLFKFIF